MLGIIGENSLSTKEIINQMSLKNRMHLSKKYLNPAIELGLVEVTHPESPKHPHQKYKLTEKGRTLLAQD